MGVIIVKTGLIIAIVVIVLGGVLAAGYFLMQPSKNDTANLTNNTTTVNNTTNTSSGNTQEGQDTQTQNSLISAAQAKAIADSYLNSNSQYVNFDAGTPSLQGTVYYVPMVVNNDNAQSAKGTVVGNVKVDGQTGAVLGTQSWDIETNEPINEPP